MHPPAKPETSPNSTATRSEIVDPGRRHVLAMIGAALFTGGLQLLPATGCSGPDANPGPGTGVDPLPPVTAEEVGIVFDNHQHDAVLSRWELEAGEPIVLHIKGHSGHDHTLTLTAEDIAAIRRGKPLSRMSSNDWGHDHRVTFNRA